MIDMTAMVALRSLLESVKESNNLLVLSGLEDRMLHKLSKIGIIQEKGVIEFYNNVDNAVKSIKAK